MKIRRGAGIKAGGASVADASKTVHGVSDYQHKEDKFRALLESGVDAVVIVDSEGLIEMVNKQTERLFGRQRQELLGRPVEVLIPQRFRGSHLAYRDDYYDDPKARPIDAGLELYGLHVDGHEFPVEISLSPIQTEDGTLVSAFIHDISARRRAEEELKSKTEDLARSNEELSRFAYIASHDLQEPLRMISSFAELLENRYGSQFEAEEAEFFHYIIDGAKRMRTMINDLLELSRISDSSEKFALISCTDVIKHATDNLAVSISESGAKICYDSLPDVFGDEAQLARLLQNLFANAIKYRSEEQPKIEVSSDNDGDRYTFHVCDNGIGIDPKFSEQIFQPFRRLHTSEQYSGSGIGLAICKKIVELHGGHIWATSNKDKGTTFHFTISASEPGKNKAKEDAIEF